MGAGAKVLGGFDIDRRDLERNWKVLLGPRGSVQMIDQLDRRINFHARKVRQSRNLESIRGAHLEQCPVRSGQFRKLARWLIELRNSAIWQRQFAHLHLALSRGINRQIPFRRHSGTPDIHRKVTLTGRQFRTGD